MRKLLPAYLLILAFMVSCFALAQQVDGKALGADKKPSSYSNIALISIKDSSIVASTTSDSTGYFSLLNTSKSEVRLQIHSFDWSTFESDTFVGEKKFGEIVLRKPQVDVSTITISGKKPLYEKTGRGMSVNVSSSPVMAGSNTKEVLEKIPGVTMHQDGSLSLKGKQNLKIFMDGKPTNLSIQDLMRLLEGMPSSEIEKIEVFEVPPAKFDAAGNAGIINIVTKKGARLGLNGMLGARVGYGNYHKFSPWLNLNYRNEKINIYGSSWFYNSMWDHQVSADMIMEIDGETSSFFNQSHRVHHGIGYGSRFGADYFINKKTTIGYLGVAYNGAMSGWEPSTVDVTGPASTNYEKIIASQDFKYFYFGHTHNLNLSHELKNKGSLNFDFDYARRGGGQDNENHNHYYINNIAQTPYFIEQDGDRKTDIFSAKVDLQKSIGSWETEAGAKVSSVTTDNIFKAFIGTNEDDVVENLNNSNEFDYRENILAAYISGIGKIGEFWSIDLGARGEYTIAQGISPTTGISFDKNYFNLFPNVALSYAIPKKWSLSTAYTSRIDRPNYHQLNPFQSQTNQFRFEQGNPDLDPQISHTVNLACGLRDAFYFTLSGSQTLGLMNRVIDQQEDLERQIHTVENLDKFENYSFNISAPWKWKWYSGQLNTTLFYNRMASSLDWGVVGYEILSFSIKSSHFFNLPKDFKMEISGFYNHDSYWNIWFVEPHYQIDWGLSKRLGSFRLNLSIKDFLNIRAGYGGVFQGDVNMATTYKPESRKVLLNLSYRFGNKKVKAARHRKTGSEDLQKRASDK